MGLAGVIFGMIQPSRDMLVRRAAPPGTAGRVFGIVSTGFNIGGIIGPLLFGWLMDHGSAAFRVRGRRRLHGADRPLTACSRNVAAPGASLSPLFVGEGRVRGESAALPLTTSPHLERERLPDAVLIVRERRSGSRRRDALAYIERQE